MHHVRRWGMSMRSLCALMIGSVVVLGCGGKPKSPPITPHAPSPREPEPVTASDPAAVAAASGVWVMTTVNDKPLPFLVTGAIWLDRSIVTVADGTYSADDVLHDVLHANAEMHPITKGTIEASDNRVMFVTGSSKTTMTIAGDTLTRITSPDVYIYKRRPAQTR